MKKLSRIELKKAVHTLSKNEMKKVIGGGSCQTSMDCPVPGWDGGGNLPGGSAPGGYCPCNAGQCNCKANLNTN